MTFLNSTCRAFLMASAGCIVVANPAVANDTLSFDSDGIVLDAGPVELTLGGRLHLDAMTYDGRITNGSNADVRRARLELSGKIADVVRFRVDREFAGTDGWRNAWVSPRPVKDLEIKGGNFTVPFSLEEAQSSNSITFVERSPVSALAPGFGLGVAAQVTKNNWTISGGYFDDALDDADGRTKERGRGFAGRATFVRFVSRSQFLHIGAAYEHRSFRANDVLRFSDGMGSTLAPKLISTNSITAPSKLKSLGAEAAYARKSLQLQGQYVSTSVSRDLAPDLNYGAWYGQVSWMLTGQKYAYSEGSGAPSGPAIGKKGGVEIAARYGQLDLDDASLDRGKTSSVTLGATWYINRNLRLMANYVRSERTKTLASGYQLADLGVARLQVAF